jgi:hypothetical protein
MSARSRDTTTKSRVDWLARIRRRAESITQRAHTIGGNFHGRSEHSKFLGRRRKQVMQSRHGSDMMGRR